MKKSTRFGCGFDYRCNQVQGAFAYTNYIEIYTGDGKKVNSDSEPFISEGTTYLP